MLTAFARAFRTPDLRKKILFTLFMILVFRIGSIMPTPNVNVKVLKDTADAAKESNQLYGLVDLFSGGALLKLSVFALGIMPYITASIILQLLVVVIPRLEALKKEGQAGTTKITQYTRYLTVGLAILQATGIVAMASTGQLFQGVSGSGDILYETSIFPIITMVICMVAGTTVIMWLGELMTDRGVGNGMSVLIFTQVVAVFPGQFWGIYKAKNGFVFALVIIVGLAIMAGVVFVEQAQRRIPVQYAKRMVGRRMYGGTSTYIPLKVNQAGIIPIIFASSLLYLPILATQLWPNTKWLQKVQPYLQQDNAWHMGFYFVLIIFFTYFYVAITFNPTEVADNMKKYGGFIPGIRPGRPTAEYLDFVLTRITTPGALYLGLVSLIPMVAFALLNATQDFPFGGASILIVVGVGLDTVKQIESQLQQRNYEGFLR
ncbi:preprotein translocase subunit SecY [Actinomadura bangladeshensis]|uniref:Protein translocase subunit SecY n=1 Tax=Actinomadura bangladeshensis TaxID=453573 RepID=A0A4R4NV62_9ACTN|nr:preprotein translocase subunit SecY [Actinomadura bangladeshensis]TDC11993.1 preprotein translocase subunit SecY [Actinomadura bangladeshensis]